VGYDVTKNFIASLRAILLIGSGNFRKFTGLLKLYGGAGF